MNRTPTPRSRPNAREVDDLVVVDAAHHDRVDLDRREPGIERGVDSREHAFQLVAFRQRHKALSVERVERDVDATQPGGGEIVRQLTELHAVGGHRDVDVEPARALTKPRHVRPHQRLAAGDPHRLEPEPLDADAGHPRDLFVGEELRARAATACPLPACSTRSGSCSDR